MKVKYLIILAAVTTFIPAFLFAAEITEEEITPRGTQKIYIDEADEYTFFQRGRLKNLLGVSFGYDNNTHLNSDRNGDAFNQTYFKTSFTSSITRDKKVTGILEYDLMTLMYWGESKLDIVKNGLHAGIENKINKEWELSGGYRLGTYSYINSSSDNFYENIGYWKVKENLPFQFYHQLGYELGFKNYPQRHIRTTASIDSDKKRNDLRNTASYEIGKYFAKDLFKIGYEYYNNNSSEKYLHYYDYDSHKFSTSLTHLFNDKIFSYLSFGRQYRNFRARTLTLDSAFKEWDRTFFFASALYYNLNKSLTVGLSYTYRQNSSNEPAEKYSGSLLSMSTYYRF